MKVRLYLSDSPKDWGFPRVEGRRSGWVAGINHGSHDASCALLHEGELVVWVEQERLSRRKHAIDESPALALNCCLKSAGLTLRDLDCVALGSNHDRLASWLGLSVEQRLDLLPNDQDSLLFPNELFGGEYPDLVVSVPHHLAHAASAYYSSEFDDAVAVVVDAMGEDSSTSIWRCCSGDLSLLKSYGVLESLGFFYEAATAYVGFTKHEAGKLMGLAAYGTARFPMPLTRSVRGACIWSLPCKLRGCGRRAIDDRIAQALSFFESNCFPYASGIAEETMVYADFAASVQSEIQNVLLAIIEHAIELAGIRSVVMAGGVALNCSANGVIASSDLIDDFFVQPAANDSGVALGAGLIVSKSLYGGRFCPVPMKHAYWGQASTAEQVRIALADSGLSFVKYDESAYCVEVAKILAAGGIVAWHNGRAEIGPRSLGARSVLADPRNRRNLARVNRVKGREIWRPLAPSVLEAHFEDYFEGKSSPFMTLAAKVKSERQREIPAVVHVDGTARPQVVTSEDNRCFAGLLAAFFELTGVPVLMNTSLNQRGEPICASPEDSIRFFVQSGVTALAIEGFIVRNE